MKETRTLEFKETISKSFLKTVSAFSNYDGGEIIFGIDDDGNVKGISDLKNVCLDIENRINDNISPQPHYILKSNEKNNTISLTVYSGSNKPYLYKSKAYKRNNTSTIEVDPFELSRLVLEGKNINYEELPSSQQKLSFNYLERRLKTIIGIEEFNQDTLITLNLYNKQEGYNNAANILSDNSMYPGIDIVKFGENINIINKRLILNHMSILEAYDKAIEVYTDYYQYEEINGSYRKKIELIPEEAIREALANALIHRAWDMKSQIRISMYDNRIEITSPGGLISGITEEEYVSGMISILRNPIISNVFYRLKIVEIFGTGILRIKQIYETSIKKPMFNVSPNVIQIILPVVDSNYHLSEDEKKIYGVLKKNIYKSMSEIQPYVPYGKTKITKILKQMEKKGVVKIEGKGKGTKYHL